MVQININAFPEEFLLNYLNFLINRVYKCLPMRENGELTLQAYIESLLRELIGNKELIYELKNNANFITLIGKLNYLSQNNIDEKAYRKDIFDSISLIEKIKKEVIS
jgi:hypothetical protein